MKNEAFESPVAHFERSRLLLALSVIVSILAGFAAFLLFREMNPWGFALMVPAVFMLFHTLWLLLNPFATLFKDRFEIRQSMLHSSLRYFNDIDRVAKAADGALYIVYRDEEIEKLNLFGIRNADKESLRRRLEEHVSLAWAV